MSGTKIANQAIREAIPDVRKALDSHPQVEVKMRAIKFANEAEWHVGPEPVPLEKFTWPELEIDGVTATAQAIISRRIEFRKNATTWLAACLSACL